MLSIPGLARKLPTASTVLNLLQFVAGDRPGEVGILDLTKAIAAEADPGGFSQPGSDVLPAELQAVVGFADGFVVDEFEDIRVKIAGLDHVVAMHRPPSIEYFYEMRACRICRLDLGNAIDRIAAEDGLGAGAGCGDGEGGGVVRFAALRLLVPTDED